jgi:hypothetical protein
MTAEEYKIQFDLIKQKRGKEPVGWWIAHDDNYNEAKRSIIANVLKNFPDAYKRELQYQKSLKIITDERLKNVKYQIIKDEKVNICNKRYTGENWYLEDKESGKDEIILVTIVSNNPRVSDSGIIYYVAKYKNGTFAIDEHEIIK